jgi:predicted AAA+ superfamily ATPase
MEINKFHYRSIDNELLEWKNFTPRKPLLLRGARQVGKSTAVKALSKHFKYYIELNFEEKPNLKSLFESNLEVSEICENLAIIFKKPIIEGETLIFLDEIQACVSAMGILRYFYEKLPDLHIIAAGSLLEFALHELPSFGVGRIRSVFMYPFSFDEFLIAIGDNGLLGQKKLASPENPLLSIYHEQLLKHYKTFLLIGGMPEVVAKYAGKNKISEIQDTLDDLIISMKADFVKYKKRIPSSRILEIFESVAAQMGGKFVLKNASNTINHLQIKESLELLIMAGLVIPVTHTSANGIPLGAESDIKKRKMLLLDTGIFQRILGLEIADILLENDFDVINKGSIAELFVGLELVKYHSTNSPKQLFYWHRETASSNAEVDYVEQKQQDIIPIEVKASGKGSMQSLYQFLSDKNRPFGIRVSTENFAVYDKIKVYPIYAVSNIANL